MERYEKPSADPLHRSLALLTATLLLGGCATSSERRAAPVEVRDAAGFSISESGRIPASARAGFD